MPDATRQAQWALQDASSDQQRVLRYGDKAALFLPRTLAEARHVVRAVLGPLVDYDEQHGTKLVRSLSVFLENNRSWAKASEELFIHRQTLVYRVKRIEELTGRRLNRTSDVAGLWLGLRVLDVVRSR